MYIYVCVLYEQKRAKRGGKGPSFQGQQGISNILPIFQCIQRKRGIFIGRKNMREILTG